MLVYRGMGWSIGEGNIVWHVTPNFSKIKKTGAILPRNLLKEKIETLGGAHDISISTYINLESAFNTIYFLYGACMIANGQWDKNHIINNWPKDKPKKEHYFKHVIEAHFSEDSVYSPTEIMTSLCMALDCTNPIVWNLTSCNLEDLVIVGVPLENEEWVFTDRVRYKVENNLPIDKYPTIEVLKETVGQRGEGFWGMSHDYYEAFREALKKGEGIFDPTNTGSTFDKMSPLKYISPYYSEGSARRNLEDVLDQEMHNGIIETADLILDTNECVFDLDKCVQYHPLENELRLFRPINIDEFYTVIEFNDVIEEARKRNNGRDPLVFPVKKHLMGAQEFNMEAR